MTVKILAFTGSLRRGSYNMAALKAAKELLPEGAEMEIADISSLPLLNEDKEDPMPQAVAEFRNKIKNADAMLISTPEYNFSIPPALKNALDWASRGDDPPVKGKTAAIMSASTGMLGGARVQYHLRQVLTALDIRAINKPEVFISKAHTKFDERGALTDERTEKQIIKLLAALTCEAGRGCGTPDKAQSAKGALHSAAKIRK